MSTCSISEVGEVGDYLLSRAIPPGAAIFV